MANKNLKLLPSTHRIIELFEQSYPSFRRDILKKIVNDHLHELRKNPENLPADSQNKAEIENFIFQNIQQEIDAVLQGSLKKVINATGVILHTGLGRAPLSAELLESLKEVSGYTNLEIDRHSGRRGERNDHISYLLRLLTGADAGLAVNNNAAAVMLMLNSVGRRKEVILSRGEMVEIGGSFRLPEVMKLSGCKLREIGTTNKTHLADYRQAIGPKTAAVLVCHPSNYQIKGFTDKPALEELVELTREFDIPLLYDLGSGSLLSSSFYGEAGEPEVQTIVAAGVDLISFSGDKLLGGPQAGLIVGKKRWVERCRKNHLLRALRLDKLMIKLIQDTLMQYLYSDPAQNILSLNMIRIDPDMFENRTRNFIKNLPQPIQSQVDLVDSAARIGSGAFPLLELPSKALRLNPPRQNASRLATRLRAFNPAIFASIIDDRVQLDLRTVLPEDDEVISAALKELLGS